MNTIKSAKKSLKTISIENFLSSYIYNPKFNLITKDIRATIMLEYFRRDGAAGLICEECTRLTGLTKEEINIGINLLFELHLIQQIRKDLWIINVEAIADAFAPFCDGGNNE